MSQARKKIHVVITGHVDHGKSTLIGRLLYDTHSLQDGKFEELQQTCKRRGIEELEWSFLLDSFQAERDQAVTIDTTQIPFSTGKRDFVIIDAPGHREFLKNMISGAAAAEAAFLIVDASEGVREQTKRHAYILSLLGMKKVTVLVNKMDLVGYDREKFSQAAGECRDYLESIGIAPGEILPVSARKGEMIAFRGENMGWYEGGTLLDVLDGLETPPPPVSLPLRFPVQDVYRKEDGQRIIVGRVETGILRKGDTLYFSPLNEKAIVESIETWPENGGKSEAHAGEATGITLSERIFVERGHIGSHEKDLPMLSNVFRANLFWISENPLRVGNIYKVRYGTSEATASVQSIDRIVDTQTLASGESCEVPRNAVALVTLRARDLLPLDPYGENPRLGRLVLYDGYEVAGGGTISMEGYPDQRKAMERKSENITRVSHLIPYEDRGRRNGYYGGVFWFTGLSGAGKSTLAMAVEKALFESGYHTYVLDGDNVRHGLNADLGFSPDDRAENIRRIGEVAALMADSGQIVITAFISPYRADREMARTAASGRFHEIYIRADLKTCETRDPKGLYRKAREGKISNFTGIDAPYEPPENPELIVDTQNNGIEMCIEQVIGYIREMTRV